jgi:hypothetical protein
VLLQTVQLLGVAVHALPPLSVTVFGRTTARADRESPKPAAARTTAITARLSS